MRISLCLSFLIVSCNRSPSDAVKSSPGRDDDTKSRFEALLSDHRENGWLVVRTPDGVTNQGDSLTFSGESMAVSCEAAETTMTAIERMQDHYDGYYVRYDPLPQEYKDSHNVVTRDGWIGVMWGMARSAASCPHLSERYRSSFHRALSAVGSGHFLHPNGHASAITPWFRVVLDSFLAHLDGEASRPTPNVLFELALEASVHAVMANHQACYPLRLALWQILITQWSGSPISQATKRDLCAETATSGTLTWDWYCQRNDDGLTFWLQNYQPNHEWIYAHQRCSWESSDLPPNASAAPLDWLTLDDLVTRGG